EMGDKHLIRVWISPGEEGIGKFQEEYSAFLKSPLSADLHIEGVEFTADEAKQVSFLKSNVDVPVAVKTNDPRALGGIALPYHKLVCVLSSENSKQGWHSFFKNTKVSTAVEWCLTPQKNIDELASLYTQAKNLTQEFGIKNYLLSVDSPETVYAYRKLASF